MIQLNYKIFGEGTPLGIYVKSQCNDASFQTPTIFYCIPEDDATNETQLSDAKRVIAENPGCRIVLISSWEVYAEYNNDELFENSRLEGSTPYGAMCIRTEEHLSQISKQNNAILTILRPAIMFGTDIGGYAETLFQQVMAGNFYGIRGCDAYRSTVCALDVAKLAILIAGTEGIFNITDGKKHRLIDIAQAMTTNIGATKRPLVIPQKLAKLYSKIADMLPAWREIHGSQAMALKQKNIILADDAVKQVLPNFIFFDTLAVLTRTEKNYPYDYVES